MPLSASTANHKFEGNSNKAYVPPKKPAGQEKSGTLPIISEALNVKLEALKNASTYYDLSENSLQSVSHSDTVLT